MIDPDDRQVATGHPDVEAYRAAHIRADHLSAIADESERYLTRVSGIAARGQVDVDDLVLDTIAETSRDHVQWARAHLAAERLWAVATAAAPDLAARARRAVAGPRPHSNAEEREWQRRHDRA